MPLSSSLQFYFLSHSDVISIPLPNSLRLHFQMNFHIHFEVTSSFTSISFLKLHRVDFRIRVHFDFTSIVTSKFTSNDISNSFCTSLRCWFRFHFDVTFEFTSIIFRTPMSLSNLFRVDFECTSMSRSESLRWHFTSLLPDSLGWNCRVHIVLHLVSLRLHFHIRLDCSFGSTFDCRIHLDSNLKFNSILLANSL